MLEALAQDQQQLQQPQIEFQQAFLQMFAQITQYQTTALVAAEPPNSSTAPLAFRTAPPDVYDGTYNKFDAFMTQLAINFSASPTAFLSNHAKIN